MYRCLLTGVICLLAGSVCAQGANDASPSAPAPVKPVPAVLPDVLAPIEDDPPLGVPIAGTAGYLPAEFLRAVTDEGAFTLDDVLNRRTHVAIEDPDAGTRAAQEVAGLIAPTLGWDATRQKEEVAAYDAQPRLTQILGSDVAAQRGGHPRTT